MPMNKAGGRRQTALRRFRELVCLACAFVLWLIAWRLEQEGYGGRRGHGALIVIGVAEALTLGFLFWKEQSTEDDDSQVPWITLAWASLPAWAALELLVGSVLGG